MAGKRQIKASIWLYDDKKNAKNKKDRFVACAKLGGGSTTRRLSESCYWASNPRKAVAGAFRQLATSVNQRRGGVFRGIK